VKTLRYSKLNNDFAAELRSAVEEYFKKNNIQRYGNREIYLKTLLMSGVYFTPFFIMIFGNISSVPLILLLWLVMGIGMSGLGMVTMHDANHGSFSKHKLVNRFFGGSLYLLGGFPPNWRFQHNTLHHGYTNIDGHDQDIAPLRILRFSPNQPIKNIHRFQFIYAWIFYGLMTFSWITIKDFREFFKFKKMGAFSNSKRKQDSMFIKLLVSKTLYYSVFLLIPLFVIPVPWYWILAGYLLMHFTGGLILSTIFQTAHVLPTSKYPLPSENNEMEYNWAVHQLYTTSDFSPGSKIFSWLIGGLNYQVIHHLFPNISHIHYRNIAPIVQSTVHKYGLPYLVNRNFLTAIREHIKMLKKLGTGTTDSRIVMFPRLGKKIIAV
jgi:linoleoyl-CoA desaturase